MAGRAFTAVVNPAAGGRVGAARLGDVLRRLRSAGADVRVAPTTGLAHARDLAAQAAGEGRVTVAVGGDGLVGAAATGTVSAEGVLGLVPTGRGNDFARQIGLPATPAALAEVLLGAPPRPVDLLETATRLVVGSVYLGIDSVANGHANRARWLPGGLAYTYGGLRAVLGWRPATYVLVVDGVTYHERGYPVVVANSGFYGGGLHVAPDAAVDDGLADVVVVRHCPRRLFGTVLRELRHGTHVRRPEVVVRRGREVTVHADRPLPAYGDGDPLAAGAPGAGGEPVAVRVRPGALRVLAPPPARLTR